MSIFTKQSHDSVAAPIVRRPMTPEEANLITQMIPHGEASPLKIDDAFARPQPEGNGLYSEKRGYLVRLLPLLVIWTVLAVGAVWKFDANAPLAFLAFCVLTAVTIYLFRKQDYDHSPAGEREKTRKALAGLKAQEMKQNYALQDSVVKASIGRE